MDYALKHIQMNIFYSANACSRFNVFLNILIFYFCIVLYSINSAVPQIALWGTPGRDSNPGYKLVALPSCKFFPLLTWIGQP